MLFMSMPLLRPDRHQTLQTLASRRARVFALAVLAWVVGAVSGQGVSPARADVQVSARLGGGAAYRLEPAELEPRWLMELDLVSEALFGAPEDDAYRFGPAFYAGTLGFKDLRLGLGLALQLPVLDDFPLVVTAMPEYEVGERFSAQTTLAMGYRSYNYHSSYGYALQAFLRGRHDFDATWMLSFGVEVDLQFFAIPAVFIAQWFRGPSAEARAK